MKKMSRRDVLKLSGPVAVAGILGADVVAAETEGNAKSAGAIVDPDGVVHGRPLPRLSMPLVECEGTAFECGERLGSVWKPVLTLEAKQSSGGRPWWKSRRYRPLIEKCCPHVVDIYRGMAKGAGVDENAVGERAPDEETTGGCTSFALAPESTLEGIPISGQTKDVSVSRSHEMLVLRMKMSDSPSMLTLTYAGAAWLFGHGFVKGGTAIFRNNIYIDKPSAGLPYSIWGLLALHCPTVDDVIDLTDRHGVAMAFHAVAADQRGGIVGIECGKGGRAYLRSEHGIYVHGNAVMSDGTLRETENDRGPFKRSDSVHRGKRLFERLSADRGRLTAQLAYGALCDHDGYPVSVCRHQSKEAYTGAAIVAEPTRGLLHVTRGAPCQNWPHTYSID